MAKKKPKRIPKLYKVFLNEADYNSKVSTAKTMKGHRIIFSSLNKREVEKANKLVRDNIYRFRVLFKKEIGKVYGLAVFAISLQLFISGMLNVFTFGLTLIAGFIVCYVVFVTLNWLIRDRLDQVHTNVTLEALEQLRTENINLEDDAINVFLSKCVLYGIFPIGILVILCINVLILIPDFHLYFK